MECEYCNQLLANACSLKQHQKTAKYCLKKQGHKTLNVCKFCRKSFTRKDVLTKHLKICKSKKIVVEQSIQKTNNEKDKLITELEDKIGLLETENKALQQTINKLSADLLKSANLRITDERIQKLNNLVNMTDEYFIQQKQYLTIEHLIQGIDGVVQFMAEHIFKNGLVCADLSRKKILYKDENHKMITEIGFLNLGSRVCEAIHIRAKELGEQYKETEYKRIGVHEKSTKEEKEKFSNEYQLQIMGKVTDVQHLANLIKGCSHHVDNGIIKTLNRDVCKTL